MLRRRLPSPVHLDGIGLHSGLPCAATVAPAPFGVGLRFWADGASRVLGIEAARARPGCTAVGVGGGEVATVEHLLAALVARGVTDAEITVEGGEVPGLDGSAAPWWAAFAGIEAGPPVESLVVPREIVVEAAGGVARWRPGEGCVVEVQVDFGLFAGRAAVEVPGDGFAAFAHARTFVLGRDIDALLAAGRGGGATSENTVIWDAAGPRCPLRMVDEPVWHKLIDAVGDLALVGQPVQGRLIVERPSHALHLAAARALMGS